MNLEEIRKNYLAQMQATPSEQSTQEQEALQNIATLEAAVKGIMNKSAWERYCTLKVGQPQKALQALVVIGQLIQQGKQKIITDEMFKELLVRMDGQKKEQKITFK